MSALPPKADIAEGDWYVRFVPKADVSNRSKNQLFDHLICAGDHESKGNALARNERGVWL